MDDYSVQYIIWIGLEFIFWVIYSYIDLDGCMDFYSFCQFCEVDLYIYGVLFWCDWWYWEDLDQYFGFEGFDLVLVMLEGDEFELDDLKEYDGLYVEEIN